jgi:hypothetical protein
VCCDARDFDGTEQHAASNADGVQLSCALQPKKRRFADFQNRQSLSARK